jgi:hypothetical protein
MAGVVTITARERWHYQWRTQLGFYAVTHPNEAAGGELDDH